MIKFRLVRSFATVTFIRSPGLLGLAYQSVTITPPLLSVWSSGMKLSASRLARQR